MDAVAGVPKPKPILAIVVVAMVAPNEIVYHRPMGSTNYLPSFSPPPKPSPMDVVVVAMVVPNKIVNHRPMGSTTHQVSVHHQSPVQWML